MTATAPEFSTQTASPPRSRIAGIDLARAVALIGMLMVHLGPRTGAGLASALYTFPHGRASILFVVVAGIGMALLTARPETRGMARLRLVWFAVVLIPMGLGLQAMDHNIAVILHHYAFYFLFGLLILGLPRKALLGLSLVLFILGPALYQLGRMEALPFFTRRSVDATSSPIAVIVALLTAGPYPLLTWCGPIAFGLWLGRLDLRAPRVRIAMIGGGIVAALLATLLSGLAYEVFGTPPGRTDWRAIFSSAPHSEMSLWLINATGVASAFLGAFLFAGDALGRWARPLMVLGQFALSAYVIHLFVLAGWPGLLEADTIGPAITAVLIYCALIAVGGMIWQRLIGRRGPVEWLMHAPWDHMRRQIAPKSRDDVGQPLDSPRAEQSGLKTTDAP